MTIAQRLDVSLEALASVCADGLAYVGDDGAIAFWNEAAADITGVTVNRAKGTPLAQHFRGYEALAQIGEGSHEDVRLSGIVNGFERVFHARAVRVEGGWIVSFGQQRRYAQIEQLKNEIVAAVSHELKTPIATIKAFATTLHQNASTLESERTGYLQTIVHECDRLTDAIDDLLEASRVGGEHLLQRRVDVRLATIVDEAAARVRLHATHALERRELDLTISGDPELLRSIFAHLLENAMKFSAPGSAVAVEAHRSENGVVVEVSDRGIGIPADHLPYIFERFYRVEESLTSATPGSGLGLFVAKMLAKAHGADLRVRSTLGEGSTFTLVFPVRQ